MSIPKSDNGWIAIHRKIWDNPRSNDPDWMSVWIYILTQATHDPLESTFKGKNIMLQPGQFRTGRKKIARDTGVEESKVNRLLKRYESEQQIEQQKSNKGTIITIKNWNDYQHNEHQDKQQMNIKRTSTEHQMNTIQEGENERIKERDSVPRKHIDNATNRMSKSEVDDEFDRFWAEYPNKKAKLKARAKFRAALNASEDTPTPETLITAAKQYAKWCRHTGQEIGYIAHPTTWLNQGRWLDELDFNQNKPKQKPKPVDPDVARSQSLSGMI